MTITDQTIALEHSKLVSDFYSFQDTFSDEENARLQGIRDFLEREVTPIADEYWERSDFPMQVIPGLAELGAFGAAWPESRLYETSAVFRGWAALEFARADASVSVFIGVTSGLAMGAIGVGGSPEQRAHYLPRLGRGEIIGAFGLTEPLSGSDTARGLRTTAKRTGDTWTLNGEKRWIGNATFADIVIIWARDVDDDQVKGFIVTKDTPGFSATKIERKQSMRSVQNADIVLENVIVPEERRLQKINSFRDVATVLRLTRAEVAWQGIGVGIGAYEAAVRYAKQREQFGKPIASYQLVQDKLANCLGNITACIAMAIRVSQMQDLGIQKDEHSALAKAYVSQQMRQVVAWCRELLGGNGIQLDHGVARFFADAEAVYSFEGTHDMNNLIVGRAITGIQAFV